MSRKPNPVPIPEHIDMEKGANWRAISQSWNQRRIDAIARVLGTKKKEDGDE